ncbi:4-hydroxy-tetrahydrodipicolinate reductase [Aquibaculum arenosum]|uniref:4-hydroxy-tetrahydrodipicolinate reductase n=1 Tax=Aquibaculum arenosum TaxID=3032591 RepID=A0ABT5YL21_9PROT|nr:4-hydroxy-tetrahydrodipicolinate reductase [Fodinicurvata sp. CAU 1616]MDF2095642.1 4-hydroxy-tetrahydrodipicolinate reductase [Fodinicurvata sp. CAU 1616]
MTRLCIAGATGWTGRAIASAALAASDFQVTGAVARSAAGEDLGAVVGRKPVDVRISASVAEALDAAPADVLIDYTHPSVVKANALAALERGSAVVIGTSGLTADDFTELDAAARKAGKGVVASGNFAITAALLSHFAMIAARHIAHFEVIDYAKAAKPDSPSGTARELAERLGDVRKPQLDYPIEEIIGPSETRGGSVNGVQVHAVRLPSYTASVDALFTVPGARLVLKHDAGTDASVYADGTLLAARKVSGVTGLIRGLDRLIFDQG